MKKLTITLLVTIFAVSFLRAEEWKQILDLRGKWKFELGDKKEWSDPKFNDGKWEEIFVPADWENEGFPNYDGYAWYRKTFSLPNSAKDKSLYLHLGYVDDVSEVYINGNFVGGYGSFPPNYETAYDQYEILPLPKKYLNENGENVIAVRVYDSQLNGGIVKGKVGIFERTIESDMDIKFSEFWKFKTGDNLEWKNPTYDDSKWNELVVPMNWDVQGYRNYDGFAWYRITFTIPEKFTKENLVLMLGKIDDIDEAYINGELIGKTGKIRDDGSVGKIREEYQMTRAYTIPSSLIRYGKENVLAVRVYDNFKLGGIYEGPIGIYTRSKFRKWQRENEEKDWQNPIENVFKNIFR